jgi:chorismate mutase / prephenate dehydratase
MNKLEKARAQIDSIDSQMAKLYESRLDAVKDVIAYKIENNLPVLDSGREQIVIEKNLNYITNPEYKSYYETFIKFIMKESKAYQRTLQSLDKVAYCGVEGAFSYMASNRLFPANSKMGVSSFEEVFQRVVNQEVQYGVIPFENTNSGLVGEVMDLLLKYPVYIQEIYDLKVEQCLLGLPTATLKDIEWVYSKDQALAQAKDYLKELNVQTVAYPNTAMAAQYVASQKDVHKAAIGAKENAELYGLKVLASNVEGNTSNTTRFLSIGLKPSTNGSRFSLLLTTKHESGALAKIIDCIAKEGLNMESIQSRPMKNKSFEYFFFIEIEGNFENAKSCVEQIKEVCESVKVLGSYSLKEDK